jgi:hypothetical protein
VGVVADKPSDADGLQATGVVLLAAGAGWWIHWAVALIVLGVALVVVGVIKELT